MKFLKNRESFLTGIKPYEELLNLDIQKINEQVYNAVPLGDSWVGRIFHNIGRKAGIMYDKQRIKPQLRKLERALEDLLKDAVDSTLDDDTETKIKFIKLTIFGLLTEISKAVYSGAKVKFIKELVKTAIAEVEKIIDQIEKIKEKSADLTKFTASLKDLLDELNKFLKFLEEFKDDDGDSDPTEEKEEGEEEDEEGDDDETEEGESDKSKQYFSMRKALSALSLVIFYMNKRGESGSKKAEGVQMTTKKGDSIDKISKSPENKEGLKPGDILAANQNVKYQGKNIPITKLIDQQKEQLKKEVSFDAPPDAAKWKAKRGGQDLKVGDLCFSQNKPLYWNGQKWVDAPKTSYPLPPGVTLNLTKSAGGKAEGVPMSNESTNTKRLLSFNQFYQNILEASFGTGGSADRNKITKEEEHLSDPAGAALEKLKKSVENIVSGDKGISVDEKFIASLLGGPPGKEQISVYGKPENRDLIFKLFYDINKYLNGEMPFAYPKDPLYKIKENYELLKEKSKRQTIAEVIARFTKRALQFDGENLYGGLGDLGKPLQEFVEEMKKIMKFKIKEPGKEEEKKEAKFKVGDMVTWTNKEGKKITKKIEEIKDGKYFFTDKKGNKFKKNEDNLEKAEEKPEEKKEEKKEGAVGESKLISYKNYYKLIREAEGDEEDKNEDDKGPESETSKKILDYWKKNFEENEKVKIFIVEKQEVVIKEIEQKLKKATDDSDKEGAKQIYLEVDPVIRVVQCFNRAYKIHTVSVIPSARTGGAVTNSIFREYVSFGGGSPESAGKSGGPYRNIKVFNIWEEGVLDLLAKQKYKILWSKAAVSKNGEEIVQGAGKALFGFMNDLLDGDELYKGSSSSGGGPKGKQREFLAKYFGYEDKMGPITDLNSREQKEQEQNTGEITSVSTKSVVNFITDPIKLTNFNDLKGTIFYVKSGDKTYYFFVHDVDSNFAYVTYSQTFYFIKYLIDSAGVFGTRASNEFKGDLPESPNIRKDGQNGEYKIKATKIKLDSFDRNKGSMVLKSYTSNYISKKMAKDTDPHDNKKRETEKSAQAEDIRVEKVFLLGTWVKDTEQKKDAKFVQLTYATLQDRCNDKGIFPKIINTPNIKDADVIIKPK